MEPQNGFILEDRDKDSQHTLYVSSLYTQLIIQGMESTLAIEVAIAAGEKLKALGFPYPCIKVG